MKKIKFIFLSMLLSNMVNAQDLHFSQTAQTPLLINPAACGVYNGWERLIVNHRNQWLGANTQFMTTSLAGDVNFGKNRLNDKAHLGLGALFFNDIGGDAKFGHQAGSLTLSGILPVGGGHFLSAGLQGTVGNRKGDINRLKFLSQWDGQQFDQTLLSGEGNSMNSFAYASVAAGLYYVYDGTESTFKRNNEFKIQFGVSAYHINRPQLKYITTNGDRMYRKFVIHADVIKDINNSRWSFDASVLQFIQGPHLETIFGGMLRHRFEEGTKITGHNQNAYFGFGAYYRLKDAIVPSILVDWRSFKFGISYDITLSKMRKAYYGGSLEFSLSYTNLNHALFKSRRKGKAKFSHRG